MSYRVTFERTFAAAHRVWNDPGKCQNIHGHNYQVTVSVEAAAVNAQGFVVAFDDVKAIIDSFDHCLIIDRDDPLRDALLALPVRLEIVPFVPSTENLARSLAENICSLGHRGFEVEVLLRETDGIQARAEAA